MHFSHDIFKPGFIKDLEAAQAAAEAAAAAAANASDSSDATAGGLDTGTRRLLPTESRRLQAINPLDILLYMLVIELDIFSNDAET